MENPFGSLARDSSKILLKVCVVLLGFGMELAALLRAGAQGLLFASATIATTLLLGYLAGQWLRVGAKTSALISAGTAICGASAIAAVGSVIGATEGEISVSMGTVFLLNGAALYLFPPLGHALGMSQGQFGTWSGVAIQDISSVVGASSHYGLAALQTATAVKLSRALWIAPMAAAAGWVFHRKSRAEAAAGNTVERPPAYAVPWFIGFFLLASVVRSFVPAAAAAAPVLSKIARAGFAVTLFLIGAGLSRSTLRAVGWKPFFLGFALWLFISATSLFAILRLIRN